MNLHSISPPKPLIVQYLELRFPSLRFIGDENSLQYRSTMRTAIWHDMPQSERQYYQQRATRWQRTGDIG